MIYAAILAGGKGTRMGGDIPKQYLELNGVPIIIHTLRAFVNCKSVDGTVVCVPREYVEYTCDLLKKYPDVGNWADVTEGGADRTGSLVNACAYFAERHEISADDVIITHDCVRPFVNDAMIEDSISAAQKFGGATAAVPSVDTICVSSNGETIDSVPDRSTLFSVQTPQTFMMKEFCELLYSLSEEEKAKLTDASAVFRLRERAVAISLGSPSNIKITHPNDIAMAESILLRQN